MKYIKISIMIIGLMLCFSSVNPAQADEKEGEGINIAPLFFDLETDPGQTTAEQILKVTNKSKKNLTRYITAMDIIPGTELGQSQLIDPSENEYGFSLGQWVKLNTKKITLEPEERKEIPFNISIPKDAEPGGHYGALVVSSQAPTEEFSDTTGVAVGHKVAALVFVNVSGDVKEEGEIISFNAINGFNEKLPVEFSIRFSNTGNTHLVPTGRINIYKAKDNQRVGSIIVNESGGRVLPKTIRDYRIKWEESEQKPGWGKYKASLSFSYGSENRTETEICYFWIFPWRLVLFGAGILLIYYFMKRAGKGRGKRRYLR